jgi:hypothetical protein
LRTIQKNLRTTQKIWEYKKFENNTKKFENNTKK